MAWQVKISSRSLFLLRRISPRCAPPPTRLWRAAPWGGAQVGEAELRFQPLLRAEADREAMDAAAAAAARRSARALRAERLVVTDRPTDGMND